MKYFFLISVILAMFIIIVLLPFAVLWAINTLFMLNISYTFVNWVATIILLGVLACSKLME